MEYFESHAHYDDEQFDKDRDFVISSIKAEGITKCINVGCDVKTSELSVELSKKYDFIFSACGIHPSEISKNKETIKGDLNRIKKIVIENKKVVAIGEIGLDYYWHNDNKETQIEVFKSQIEMANELDLPIIIHTREAIDDTINILRNCQIKNTGVLHCCPFNKELVKHGLKANFYIAFGGTCTFKNSKNADEIINMVPVDKILIETDSPYLAPQQVRGTRNDSRNLKYVVEKIADVKNMLPEEIAKITYNNAMKLFKI